MQTKIISAIVIFAIFCGTLSAQERSETQTEQPYVVVEILVLDGNNNPIPDATVSINPATGRPEWHGKTNNDGLVWVMYPTKQWGRSVALFALSPDGREVQSHTLRQGENNVTVQLCPPVKVIGQIVDRLSGKPIPNVSVRVNLPQHTQVHKEFYDRKSSSIVMTDEQGYCRFDKAIPGTSLTFDLYKNISEEDPAIRMYLGQLRFNGGTGSVRIDRGESFDLGVAKWNANELEITVVIDRFMAASYEEGKGNLEERFEDMFKRAKKNGRNVLFIPYGSRSNNIVIDSHRNLLRDPLESFEFIKLHTPVGIGRNSHTFEILKEMTGQEVQPYVCMIAFSADGKFLGLYNSEDVRDRDTSRLNIEKARQFLESHAPQVPEKADVP